MGKFFQVLGTSVKDLDGSDIVDISTTLNKPGKLVRYVLGNGSTGLLRIKISSALNLNLGVDIAEKCTHITLIICALSRDLLQRSTLNLN